MKLKDTFIGTGSMKKFCEETNKLFSAVNNCTVIMPQNYVGIAPTMKISGKGKDISLVFDMGNALVFTLNNIAWNFSGTAKFVSYSASVDNGQLNINITANA